MSHDAPPLTLRLAPLSEDAIAPFGAVISPPADPGDRRFYTRWLGSDRAGMTPRLHVNHVPATTLPRRIDLLERHLHSAQVFLPLDVTRYVIVVAPGGPDGMPDPAGARAFLVPGTLGILYAPGAWHAGAAVLDRAGSFGVLAWRNDTADDEDFAALSRPLQIRA